MSRDLSRRSAFGAKADRDRKLELALKHELRTAGTPDRDACLDAETLGAWADGGLDAAQMASVEVHVATCARCQAIVGVTARSAPMLPVSEAPGGFSLWKWWLAPIAAGAAAVTLWMVVPQGPMQAPPAPATAIEARKDTPAESQARESAPAAENTLADASRKRANSAPAGLEDRQGRREESPERKQKSRVADQAATGAVAALPPPAPAAAAPVAEQTLQKSARPPLEFVSSDSRWRWRVTGASIERSEDAGVSWMGVHQVSGDTITGGIAPAGSICWLIGANGMVLLSADGTTFARVPIPERVNLTGITASDARSATVTAADGRRFRTGDSGRSWRQD